MGTKAAIIDFIANLACANVPINGVADGVMSKMTQTTICNFAVIGVKFRDICFSVANASGCVKM